MKTPISSLQASQRSSTPVVKSVMPGSIIVPELRYSIPFTPFRSDGDPSRRLDIDFHRHGVRHAMSGQRI
jgi:hypothetical protein